MKLLFIFWIGIYSGIGLQQKEPEKYPFSKWDAKVLEEANTGITAKYLSAEEKKVIFYCNLARYDGKLFSETYLQQYLDSTNYKRNSYVTSLFSRLKKVKKLPYLSPQEDLFKAAKAHVDDSGKKGTIGHQNVTKRMKTYAERYGETAENCDYGNNDALEIVMSLLIDEDVADKGHRENILDKDMLSVGVCIGFHKKYDWMCVMDFGNLK